jgi:hypothetical protein
MYGGHTILVLTLLACAAPCAAVEPDEPEPRIDITTHGWLLEFDDGTDAGSEASTPGTPTAVRSVPAASTGVELIIGGQGKDGVARKGVLPVVD